MEEKLSFYNQTKFMDIAELMNTLNDLRTFTHIKDLNNKLHYQAQMRKLFSNLINIYINFLKSTKFTI